MLTLPWSSVTVVTVPPEMLIVLVMLDTPDWSVTVPTVPPETLTVPDWPAVMLWKLPPVCRLRVP